MIETRLLSSLEKVFLDDAPAENLLRLTALQNEKISFQLAFRDAEEAWQEVSIAVEAPRAANVRIR